MSDLVLGGYTALAESAWMGAAQASDVLESLASTATLETLLLGMALLAKLRRRIRVFDYNSDTN